MKIRFLILLIAAVIISCSSSNEPKDSEYYVYHSTPFEVIKVYGESGAEIPKSQWDEEINEAYDDFKMNEQLFKIMKFKFEGDSIILNYGDTPMAEEYRRRGDTIFTLANFWGEEFEMPTALQINSNTIEFHNSAMVYIHEFGSSSESGIEIGITDNFMEELGKTKEQLKAGERLAIFSAKYHFKK